jgi:Amino-transferase class IV
MSREYGTEKFCKATLCLVGSSELTEGSRTNLFFELEGRLWTPPQTCGLLPGILRQGIIARGGARERAVTVDPNPANPWGLQTIYGIAAVPSGANILTAANNGDLCVIDPVAGMLFSRTRCDQNAQRGLNDVSALGDYVITVNCAVGSTQPNLWLFQVQADYSLKLLDSKVLREDSSLPQAFAFCVRLSQVSKEPVWFAATEEGLLWSGRIVGDQLTVLGNQVVVSHYGASLAVESNLLVVAGDALHVYGID